MVAKWWANVPTLIVIAGTWLFVKWRYRVQKPRTGVVEKIDLTFGGAGNQWMTIDGERYATWIDFKDWPKIGDTVTHQPFIEESGPGNGMQSTRIISQENSNG